MRPVCDEGITNASTLKEPRETISANSPSFSAVKTTIARKYLNTVRYVYIESLPNPPK